MVNQSNKLTGEILNGPILPLLLRLASPNVLAFLIQSSVSIAEVWYVGQLGTLSLAGLALVFPMFMLMHMMSAGALGGAVASSVARSIGQGAIDRGQALIWHALILALTGASIFSAGSAYLRFVGSVYAFQGVGLALYFASQGAGTVLWPVVATIVRVVVAVGGAAVAVVSLGYGITSLFLWVAVGMLLFGCINALSLRLGAWGRIQK